MFCAGFNASLMNKTKTHWRGKGVRRMLDTLNVFDRKFNISKQDLNSQTNIFIFSETKLKEGSESQKDAVEEDSNEACIRFSSWIITWQI